MIFFEVNGVTPNTSAEGALLDEYGHRCAVCDGDRPHVHRIDEDASNNELLNRFACAAARRGPCTSSRTLGIN